MYQPRGPILPHVANAPRGDPCSPCVRFKNFLMTLKRFLLFILRRFMTTKTKIKARLDDEVCEQGIHEHYTVWLKWLRIPRL